MKDLNVCGISGAANSTAITWPVQGVDLSVWQGAVDFAKLAKKAQFAFLRAGYGNNYYDSQCPGYTVGCDDHGIEYGLYWYLKPGKDFRQHADNFASIYKDIGGKLPPVADIEESGGLDKVSINNWLTKFVDRFEAAAGVKLMIYTSPGFFNAFMPMTNWAKWRKLWVAAWTTAELPTLPNEWTANNNPRTFEFWQHTSKGPGLDYGVQSKSIDLNRYRYGVTEFNAEYNTNIKPLSDEVPPPPPPPPAPIFLPHKVTVTASALNVRALPDGSSEDMGTLRLGSDVWVEDQQGDWLYFGGGWIHKNYVK